MEKPVLARVSKYIIFISFTYLAKKFSLSRKCTSVYMSAGLAGPRRAVGSQKSEVSGSSDSSAAESFPISVSFHLSYVVDAWLIFRGLY